MLFTPTLDDGPVAEYALLPADAVLAQLASLDFMRAAALPLAAVEAAGLQPGQTVLIAGAGGGVGSFAIQLALTRGATVIATGLPEDADGADLDSAARRRDGADGSVQRAGVSAAHVEGDDDPVRPSVPGSYGYAKPHETFS